LDAPVIAQNEEAFGRGVNAPYQLYYWIETYRQLRIKSPELEETLNADRWKPPNMGVFGGNDLEFIRRYNEDSIATMMEPRNYRVMKELGDYSSVFLEQFLLWAHSHYHKTRIRMLIDWSRNEKGEQWINDTIQWAGLGYCHLFGEWKRWHSVQRFIRRMLRREHHEVFQRVLQIAKGLPVYQPDPTQVEKPPPPKPKWKGRSLRPLTNVGRL
jgi:hypothetical protein